MSASDGRHSSHIGSHASSTSASTATREERRRSLAANNDRLNHVISVEDASRVLECSQTERQRRFQHTVRQYMSQILHGCKNAYCDTPTCFSSNKRHASRPYRPPTQLTATTLAHYLASQDNPNRALCPHELQVSASSFEVANHVDAQGQHGEHAVYPSVYPSVWRLVKQYRHARKDGGAGDAAHKKQHEPSQQSITDVVGQRQQARKDPKSLGQNLYDSITIIYSYTKQIPSPASVLSALHATDPVQAHDHRQPKQPTETGSRPDAPGTASNADHISHTIGDPATPHVNRQQDIVRHNSQSNTKSHGISHLNATAIDVSSNGLLVHRIPYHPPPNTTQARSLRPSDPTTHDGASDLPMLSIAKTGKKNFTIGGASLPTTAHTKPLPAQPKQSEKDAIAIDRATPGVHIVAKLSCDVLDEFKEDVFRHGQARSTDFNYAVDYDSHRRVRRTKPTVNRSLFYTLSNPETLLTAFHDANEAFKDSPLPHLDSTRLVNSFRDWNQRNGALIFDSLWLALGALFIPPPELDVQKSPRLKPSRKGAFTDSLPEQPSGGSKEAASTSRYISTHEAAHIAMICIHALTSLVPNGWPHTWAQIRKLRSWGVIVPNAVPNTDAFSHPYMDIIDGLEFEPALRLADRLLRAIGTRACFEHIHESTDMSWSYGDDGQPVLHDELVDVIVQHLIVVERVALATKRRMYSTRKPSEDPGWTVTATFMEWLRTIIIKKWDGKPEINKWSSVGTAVMVMNTLHLKHQSLNLRPNMFEMPFFNERLDIVSEPVKFLDWEESEQPNTLHIFEYPCLFSAQHLVAYFRTINFTIMMKQYDHTMRTNQMQRSLDMFIREPYWWIIKSRMKVTLSEYLVLDVSRENPLKDTLDQLWGQDHRMLLKPLKVKMGHHEGEVGLDHGGVTYEFFRVVLGEAFKPDNGMFTIDPQTRMTWFQPDSLEPEWKFQMLGILFSLAVYNGITLPVTFPLALYDYITTCANPICERGHGSKVDYDPIEHIQDGWPDLAKSFQELLSWSNGDVADIFMREYVFSYEVFGQRIDKNLMLGVITPGDPSTYHGVDGSHEEPIMVTNANRAQYVYRYVMELTHRSVAPQLMAFLKGFHTCINAKSLTLFTPSSLRNLIEGTQHISIPSLRRCAKYEDGYSATHSVVRNFWSIVESYSQEDCRHLLEFVTASDRVPVTGYESIVFHVVKIGGAPLALPSSSTCFGKLYLPEYDGRAAMEGKLGLAIRNSRGFGVV